MIRRTIPCITTIALCLLAGFAGGDTDSNDVPLGHAEFKPSPTRPVGFRGDHSGVFPGATPPVHWDERTGKGIKWRTTMPGTTVSSPIYVGGKVFALASPDMLVCCNAETGKIEWIGETLGVMFPEQLKDSADRKKWREAYNKGLRYAWATRKPFNQLVEDIASKLPEDHGLREWVKGDKQLNPGDGGTGTGDPMKAIHNKRERAWEWCWVGDTFTPPVSDGQFIYAYFSIGGTIACWDLEGNLQWTRRMKKPNMRRRKYLAQEMFLHGDLLYLPAGFLGKDADLRVVNRRTGKTVHTYDWEGESGVGQMFCPFEMDGKDYLMVRHEGGRRQPARHRILDLATGKEVGTLSGLPKVERSRRDLGPNVGGFVIRDGVIYVPLGGYYYKNAAGAGALTLTREGDKWRAEKLWKTDLRSGPATPSWRGLVVVGDEVYIPRGNYSGSLLDRQTGQKRKEWNLTSLPAQISKSVTRRCSDTYPTVAGDYLYYTSWSGVTSVYDLKNDKNAAANFTGPSFGSTLFFHGSRGYLRSFTSLYCLGE